MKTRLTLLITFFALTLYSQSKSTEIVTLEDGKEIIVNLTNKTWEFHPIEMTIKTNPDSISSLIPGKSKSNIVVKNSSIDWVRIYKYPIWKSPEIKDDFSKSEDIEIVGYANSYFKIKTLDSKFGYIDDTFLNVSYSEKNRIIKELQEKDIKAAKDNGQKLLINGILVYGINSSDGVKFRIECGYFDKSKDIKYLNFTVLPYNSVGDIQTCEISSHSYFEGQITGPISAEDIINEYYWDCAWYNNTISCLKITKVNVVYMDGSSYTYINELPKIMNSEYKCSCK